MNTALIILCIVLCIAVVVYIVSHFGVAIRKDKGARDRMVRRNQTTSEHPGEIQDLH